MQMDQMAMQQAMAAAFAQGGQGSMPAQAPQQQMSAAEKHNAGQLKAAIHNNTAKKKAAARKAVKGSVTKTSPKAEPEAKEAKGVEKTPAAVLRKKTKAELITHVKKLESKLSGSSKPASKKKTTAKKKK